MVSNQEIKRLLDKAPESQYKLPEDLMIEQPDGTKACLNWELRGKGYQLGEQAYKNPDKMSDAELLKDAYKELSKK